MLTGLLQWGFAGGAPPVSSHDPGPGWVVIARSRRQGSHLGGTVIVLRPPEDEDRG